MTFDWGNVDANTLSWAAFYGDCAHEVQEVTEGHRVTLTYNLYHTAIGDLGRPVANTVKLPFYKAVKEMYDDKWFMEKGMLT